jgi:hypothetical protein
MLTVVMTSMPAASSSSTSSQRLALRLPGTLVWANSSTSATAGRRASTASTSSSSKVESRYVNCRRGTSSRSRICAAVLARRWVST